MFISYTNKTNTIKSVYSQKACYKCESYANSFYKIISKTTKLNQTHVFGTTKDLWRNNSTDQIKYELTEHN